jgi:hypothetical protein
LLETSANPGWPALATSSPTNASKAWVPGVLWATVTGQVVPASQTASSAPAEIGPP